jgi:hypothetical protein
MRIFQPAALAVLIGACAPLALPVSADAQISIGVSVNIAPPALPVYVQPALPAPGYIWTPGYWAWSGAYYWVPGTWVLAPRPGLLWTPGYWGWNNGLYAFNPGYWGPHVGFYGGISYGFGYTGVGFQGGYWNNGSYFYNSSVNNVTNSSVTNVYNKTIVNNTTNNVSYNGGAGGVAAKPTPQEMAAANEPHVAPTGQQMQHQQAASKNPALFAGANHGHPAIAATPRPGAFGAPGVVPAGGAAKPQGGGAPAASGPPPQQGAPARMQMMRQAPPRGAPPRPVRGGPPPRQQQKQPPRP